MNSVAFAERSKVARHEAVHASASIFFGVTPAEIRIVPLADDESGYVSGWCQYSAKPSVNAVVTACGVRDGHGVRGNKEGDVYELEQLVRDPNRRAEVLAVAEQVMEHRQFKAVRDALRTRLQFRDVMYADEIAKVARAAAGRPVGT